MRMKRIILCVVYAPLLVVIEGEAKAEEEQEEAAV
jgi:hypothetical protein